MKSGQSGMSDRSAECSAATADFCALAAAERASSAAARAVSAATRACSAKALESSAVRRICSNCCRMPSAIARSLSPVLLVAVTAYNSAEAQNASREAGFDMHLAKPAMLDQIISIAARPRPNTGVS
jgi:hypothetical protein